MPFSSVTGSIHDNLNKVFCEIAYGINEREFKGDMSLSTWNINGSVISNPDPLDSAQWDGHRLAAKGLNITRVLSALSGIKNEAVPDGEPFAGNLFRDFSTGGPLSLVIPTLTTTTREIGNPSIWIDSQDFLKAVYIMAVLSNTFSLNITARTRESSERQYPVNQQDWGAPEQAMQELQWAEAVAATPYNDTSSVASFAELKWTSQFTGYVFSGPVPIAQKRKTYIVDRVTIEVTCPVGNDRIVGSHFSVMTRRSTLLNPDPSWDVDFDGNSVNLPFTDNPAATVLYYIDRDVPGGNTTQFVVSLLTVDSPTIPFYYTTGASNALKFGQWCTLLDGSWIGGVVVDVLSCFLMNISNSLEYV